ncbi:MAG: hypothetical protein KJ568_05095 [Actinobacteria bacterium]|nr:hypothetical protein [Actinomycetota bacterium]
MIKKIKTILVLLFCLVITLSYATGCRSDSSNLLQGSSENQAEDANGSNDSIDARLTGLKNKIVSPPVVISHKSGEEIYSSGDRELIFIKGYADNGNTIEIYVNGILKQSDIIVDNDGVFETLKGIEIVEGKNVIELVSVKPSGSKSSPTEFNLFLIVPQKVEYGIFEDPISLKEIEGTYYSTEINPTVYIYGSHLPSSQVFILANDKIVGEIVADGEGTFELDGVMLKPGNNEIAVWAKAGDGFVSAPVFTNIIVSRDLSVPIPSDLTGYNQGSANYLSWGVSVDTDFDSYKLVRVEDPCINPEYPENDVIATFNNISVNSYIDNDIVSGKSYYYTLWTLDKARRVVSSNVVAIPKPVYSIAFNKVPSSISNTIARREWFYQAYEMTNTGNVTIDIQPLMVWLKLEPNPDEEMEISPLWEAHIWDPNGQYYYSKEDIYSTYIADWVNFDGSTETEETTTFSTNGLIKTVTVTETIKKTEKGDVNLKRIMTTTTNTTITVTDLTTGISTVTTTTDTDTEIVEPEIIGSPITGLEPGEKIIIEVKVQNIAAENGEKIIVHFHFAPVDCDGHFYIDEIVSTLDIIVIGKSRN